MSNGRQIGSIVGSLIAAYFTAGTSYAAFAVAAGGAIGGAIGGAVDPEKLYGPRLEDTKISVSTYGAVIPRIYGTFRGGGITVWCTDRQEVVKTEDVGKGGGAEQTSYSYYVHMRVLLCERPADGSQVNVVQIFQDGKLVWDASSGLSIGQALATAESPLSNAVLYQGDENQLPDPYEEMFDGVGNAPPFRDFISISLRNVDCPGGRVPQFSFVFSASSTVGNQGEQFAVNHGYAGLVMPDRIYGLSQTGDNLTTYPAGPGYSGIGRVMGMPSGSFTFWPRPIQDAEGPLVARITNSASSYQVYVANLDSGLISATINADVALDFYYYGGAAYDQALGKFAISPGQDKPVIVFNGLVSATLSVTCDAPIGYIGAIAIYNGVVYALVMGATNILVQTFDADDGSLLATYDTGVVYAGIGYQGFCRSTITATAAGVYCYLVDADSRGNLLSFNGTTFATLAYNMFAGDEPWSQQGWGLGSLLTMFCDGKRATIGPCILGNDYKSIFINRVTLTDIKVKDVIAAEMDRIGESRYSVDGIPDSDVITGFSIASQSSTRAAIEPLKTAFQIYQVDEDGLIKFKKYKDIAALAYVSYDELGFSADDPNGDIFPLQRTQEIDLPRSVTVNYIQPGLDFNVANETERRQTTGSIQDVSVESAIAMSSDVAKGAALAILYSAWNAQNTRQASVARKFSFLSPGDGVNIEYPRGTVGLWRITSFNDDGRVIQWTVEPGDATLFSKTAAGTTDFNGQVMESLPPPTVMDIIDGSILQDADNNAGLYVAMAGAGSLEWNGAELWAGIDDASLESVGTVQNAVVRGFAENALGNFSLGIMDGINSVTVNVGEGELSSATRAALDANQGLNAFALGINGRWEYCQFMTATDLGNTGSGRRYTLSGLLRGARGTIHNRGNHAANDRFVMLGRAGTLRPVWGTADVGQPKYYRAVSQGRSLNSASSQVYANTAEGLKPFAPWDARKSKAANNDQTITWERCSRLSTNALRGIVPQSEAVESYIVHFYSDGTFTNEVGQIPSDFFVRSLTITSAEQTAFGLTPGATLYVRIYPTSDIGRGHYLQAIL